MLAIVWLPLGSSSAEFVAAALPWRSVQLIVMMSLLFGWSYVSVGLLSPTASERRECVDRMHGAVQRGTVRGLTESWWRSFGRTTDAAKLVGIAVVFALLGVAGWHSYPSSIYAAAGCALASVWTTVHSSYEPAQIFLFATVGCHVIIFWTIGLISALLEFTRPAWLEPFKVQQDAPRLTCLLYTSPSPRD